jgi:UDP-glucuronate 4-epimerase
VADKIPETNPNSTAERPDPGSCPSPHELYNIGNNSPVKLLTMIEIMENALGRDPSRTFYQCNRGDVIATYADSDGLSKAVNFAPKTPLLLGWKSSSSGIRCLHCPLEWQFSRRHQ